MKIVFMNLLFVLLLQSLANGQMTANTAQFSQYRFDLVQIEGKTNVNDFQMNYSDDQFYKLDDDGQALVGMQIPADKVEADSKVMKNDFLDLIHAKKYPTITIGIDHNQIRYSPSEASGKKEIELTMNGVTRQFQCQTTSEFYSGEWELNGKLHVRLTDFNIDPPRKFLGLVKVEDEIFINFRVLFL